MGKGRLIDQNIFDLTANFGTPVDMSDKIGAKVFSSVENTKAFLETPLHKVSTSQASSAKAEGRDMGFGICLTTSANHSIGIHAKPSPVSSASCWKRCNDSFSVLMYSSSVVEMAPTRMG